MLRSRRQIGRGPLTVIPVLTRVGIFVARFSGEGLAELDFPGRAAPVSERVYRNDASPQISQWSAVTKAALDSALLGQPPDELPPLDVRAGTDFQKRVWAALGRIPLGKTKSYAEIAREIGSANATRAVGGACGANPGPILIPCHRVVASGGRLGGFSGGLNWKMLLLSIEGAWNGSESAGPQGKFSF